jgi:hypothetical protein
MAFNFGAFLGGAAKAGLQTYQMLSEEEERELIKEERRRRIEKERAIEAAGRETLGRAGTQTDYTESIQGAAGVGPQQAQALQSKTDDAEFDRAVAQSAVDVMREGAARKGALPTGPSTVTAKEYTQEQADKDYIRRLSAIDPRLGRQARVENFQIKELERKEAAQNKFNASMDKLDKDLATIESAFESKGMLGLYETAKKNGLNVKYVEPKSETNALATIQLIGKDGKVERIFTSGSEAAEALREARMGQFESEAMKLLGDPKSIIDAMRAKRTEGREDQRLGMEQQRLEMELKTNPARIEQIRASISASNASARVSNLQADKLRDMQSMNAQMEELLKNPKENASAIIQLASRMELRFPDVYTRTGPVRDSEGNQTQVTTGILGNVVKGTLKASGVAILPTQSLPILRDAAAAAKGDSKKFLASQAAKTAMGLGATPEDLIKDFMPQAAPTKQPQSAIPAPSTTNNAAESSSVASSGRGATVTPNIPPPPPRTIQQQTRGGIVDTGRPNPEYEAWERKYGRYQTQ